MLSSREATILQGIIESFILSGTPIGSRTLVKSYDLDLSSATIRNVMSDLEELGYLTKTHQSSGRIPSIKGLKLYVSNLIAKELSENRLSNSDVRNYLEDGDREIKNTLSKIGTVLNEITDYASLTFISKDKNGIVKDIFIKEVSSNSYIFAVMLSDDEIFTKLITTEEANDFISTEKFNRFLGENFKNKSTKYLVDNLLPLFNFTFYKDLKVLNDIVNDIKKKRSDELQLSGISRLLNHPDFDDIDKVRQVANLMSDDTEIRDVLTHEDKDGIKVYLSDDEDDPLSSLAIITSNYSIDEDRIASFGLIAPIRINYSEAVSTIIGLDRDLKSIINKNRGKVWWIKTWNKMY